jgi:hypothetical protein
MRIGKLVLLNIGQAHITSEFMEQDSGVLGLFAGMNIDFKVHFGMFSPRRQH